MDAAVVAAAALRPRATDTTSELLKLIEDPFTTSNFSQDSVWASLGTSVGFTLLLAVLFSFLRPFNSVVYAPKLKHADEKHAPPPMGKGTFAWFTPLIKTTEQDLVHFVGLDATIFLRFARMCRNIFISVSIVGCGILIPINLSLGAFPGINWLSRITPINTFGQANWGQVVCAYLFNIIVSGFLYFNYRKVLGLRRQYFNSEEYQHSLHARTLMVYDLPKNMRTDEGISKVIDEVAPDSSFSRTAIARNVKDLPDLIAEHDKTVRELEKLLAKYLHNPDNLPKSRPMCKPSKEDPSYGSYPKGQKVDAIEYLTGRIRDLEVEIKEIRLTVDKRNAMQYGFASFDDITEAHTIAFAARKKHPEGTTIVLAPKPNDVIWKNMPLNKSTRRSKAIWINLSIALLTILWIVPNILISIFVVDLQNLGAVWPAFMTSLEKHTTWWALVQGVASPALTSLVYLVLPIIFRRMSIRAGDKTKTERERHVMSKLYNFFVFNNLAVFAVFQVAVSFVISVVNLTGKGESFWDAMRDANFGNALVIALCRTSPFWVTYLLQRNLGAAVDLAQLWALVWSFCMRKFSSPTPRQIIELTAPQAFDYASYYNYFLFYSTIALAFATIQPLVLPAAALYFSVDVYLKKYLLLYIFITKTESGGMFWRVLFNRMVFACILGNLMVFICVFGTHGDGNYYQAFCVAPLPILMIGFKIYCMRTFDDKIQYASRGTRVKDPEFDAKSRSNKSDRLAARYGHPALYRRLITPMVHARAQNVLAAVYKGRLTDSNQPDSTDIMSMSGYSDTYALDNMKAGLPGRSASGKGKTQPIPGFEVVQESQLDFAFYKNRAEFGDEHGAGQIYQSPTDLISRPGTPGTLLEDYNSPSASKPGSPVPGNATGGPRRTGTGLSASESTFDARGDIGATSFNDRNGGGEAQGLVEGAAPQPMSTPLAQSREHSLERRAPGFLGGGPQGYGNLPQQEEEPLEPAQDPMNYDYFRSRRQNAGWQGWTG